MFSTYYTIQCFISADGYSGFNLEHSAADGTTALQITIYNISNMYVIIVVCIYVAACCKYAVASYKR